MAKASEKVRKEGNDDFKGYVCCAIFSNEKCREGEREAIIKAKDKIESMRLETLSYTNCGILIFSEFPEFRVLLKTCNMADVQRFIEASEGYELLQATLAAVGYNPSIPLADIKNCLGAYRRVETEETETELSEGIGNLFD